MKANRNLAKKNIYHGVEEELHGGHGVLRGGVVLGQIIVIIIEKRESTQKRHLSSSPCPPWYSEFYSVVNSSSSLVN
jgi:hypothetical protein